MFNLNFKNVLLGLMILTVIILAATQTIGLIQERKMLKSGLLELGDNTYECTQYFNETCIQWTLTS